MIARYFQLMIETSRLLLRQWVESDLKPWAEMNADPEVMHYFPATLTPDESSQMMTRIRDRITENGWGLWAVEVKATNEFIGFIGLSNQDLGQPWTPCIEIGWRLKRSAWGQGFATEGASAALDFGKQRFDTIYSFTAASNLPSQRVMQRIGLHSRPDLGFDHPRVTRPDLIAHVVYSTQPSPAETDEDN